MSLAGDARRLAASSRSPAASNRGSSLFEALRRCSVTSVVRSKPSYDAVLAAAFALAGAGRRRFGPGFGQRNVFLHLGVAVRGATAVGARCRIHRHLTLRNA